MVTMLGADIPAKTIRGQIASAIHVIVQLSRLSDGSRKVVSISEIAGMESDVVTIQDIFVFRKTGRAETGQVLGETYFTGVRPKFFEAFQAAGIDTADLLLSDRRAGE
jgi:pilus assembly protein CpaF